jgi:hypothetical protein
MIWTIVFTSPGCLCVFFLRQRRACFFFSPMSMRSPYVQMWYFLRHASNKFLVALMGASNVSWSTHCMHTRSPAKVP